MSDSIEKIIADLHPWLPKAISIQFAQRLRSLRQVPEDCVLVPREEQDALLAVVRESTYGSDLGREGRAKVALQNYTDGMQAKTNPAPPTSGREELANVSGLREAMLVVADRIEHRADLLPPSVPTDRHMFRSYAAEIRILANTIKQEATPAQAGAELQEVGGNANISDVLCASFGQYFEVSGIVELDIQDDDQVRPLLAYMAQGVADYFLRDGNKLANLLYSMGDAVQASEWENVQRELIELRSKVARYEPTPAQAWALDGYRVEDVLRAAAKRLRLGVEGHAIADQLDSLAQAWAGLPELPFSPYLVSEWAGPEMMDRRTWTAYTADQMREMYRRGLNDARRGGS